MARGQLVAESLGVGRRIQGVPMRLLGVTRVEPPAENLAPGQPHVWTFIGFEIDDADAERLAEALREALLPGSPWYCNFTTADEMWVVFAGVRFHYPLNDGAGRASAEAYARSQGVPEPQLDWHGERSS